jgi:hypothetical protein
MLNWFRSKPTCPVNPEEQAWIERRFAWLTEEFGPERLKHGTLILPTTDFFPSDYDGTESEIADIMQRVARYMDVDPTLLRLNFYEENHPRFEGQWTKGTTGLFREARGRFEIWLEVTQLEDPFSVVATLAHEIGHVVLIGQRRISPALEDHEPLTDLVTVFLGLGLFTANSVIHEHNWSFGQWSGWSVGRRGYLSMSMYGYALALYALARSEPMPSWAVHLRPDVRSALKQGIRYLSERADRP